MANHPATENSKLVRRLNLPLLVLYGLGVTIGAGIYVLVGATASKAGIYAPLSFVLAAIVVAFTGCSYTELSTRFPVSAGEATYVRNGFKRPSLALIVGLLVIMSGVVSSAAVSLGAGAYLHQIIPLPALALSMIVIVVIGLIAMWGILESVALAALFTLVEITGLLMVVGYAIYVNPGLFAGLPDLFTPSTTVHWTGIISAGLLAFFAFIGFEDIANIAEEVKNPRRNMPRGIIWTLILTTLIYVVVVSVVVLAVPLDKLTQSSAPLSLVFEDAGFTTSGFFSLIAIIATMNGVLIQVVMASRVLFGLADQGTLPAFLAKVNSKTHTPITATAIIIVVILFLAAFIPIAPLAELTSSIVLLVFTLVNLSLILIKIRKDDATEDIYQVPIWVPSAGFISSGFLLVSGLLAL